MWQHHGSKAIAQVQRLGRRGAPGLVLVVLLVTGQGLTALGASTPGPGARPVPGAHPGRAQRLAAEQLRAVSAARVLGLGSGQALVVKDVIADADGSTHVRYARTFDGLRVIGGDLVSHRDSSGKVKGVSWNGAHQVAVASKTPTLSVAVAKAAGARRAVLAHQRSTATGAELVVFSGSASGRAAKNTVKLAYDVLSVGVRADQTPSRLHSIVDASTGATLGSFDEIENGTGHGIYAGAGVSINTTAGPPWSMGDVAGNVTTDLFGSTSTTAPGTTFTDADNSWGDGTVSDRASAGVDAHYGAEKTFDYYNSVLGRNGVWNTGVGARSRVHFGTGYDNAFWDGTQMTYGDGAGDARPLVELDIAGHEMSHGVTENTAALGYSGDAGGLNEATSDIFGTSVEWYANNAADTPDYLIGELVNINGNGTPLRYLDRPSRDGVSPDCWSATVGTLDPHYSSGPLNHWFYLASEGSGAKVLNGVSYDSPTCNASTVPAIGRDAASKIWYRTLSTYLTSSSTYPAAREGAIQAAKDLYGASSPECSGIAASFSAIAVPPGAATCGVPTPPSGGNLLDNSGFESGSTSWSATPNVIGQWGVDQPAHSGTWSAWLGGYGSTHDDSTSQLVTIPTDSAATLSYYVHIDTFEAPASQAYDTLTVRAGSTVLQTLSNLDAASGYQPRTVDLSAYVGRTIALSFSGSEDAAAATSFVVDDALVTTPSLHTAPAAPRAVTATAGDSQAVVWWSAPGSNGGSPVTGYAVRVVNASTGGQVGALRPGAASATSLVVTGLTNGTAYTFQVRALNVYGPGPYSAISGAVTPAPTAAVTRLSDFNRDGKTDLVARDGGGILWLYPGDGAGGFTSRHQMGTGWAGLSAIVTPGDVTGDGNADVLARTSDGALWLYPGNGASGFGARRLIGSGWQSFAVTNAADLTGDLRPDLLARDSAGQLWLYPLAGNAVFQPRRSLGLGWQGLSPILGPGDVSGDGRPDILARTAGGSLNLYRGNGSGSIAQGTLVSGGWQGMTALVTPGNWNRAVGNDVLTRDAAGALWLYPGDSAGHFGPARVIGSGWGGMTYLG